MSQRVFALLLVLAWLPSPAGAQSVPGEAGWLLPMPEVDADPAIPTLSQVVGHSWGADVSSASEIERYLSALAAAAPDRSRLVPYGRTIEKRGLAYLVITSPANLARLDEIRETNLRLADPRKISRDEARPLIESLPAILWMAYGVHGDEISSGDAAILTAYHLLADRREETRRLLDRVIVIIDPMQNPDGRDRFVNFHREGRGVEPDAEPLAAERVQRWATGRHNHYLFDMNRDWFLQTQSESRDKVAAYLRWQPHVLIDAHEMGSENEYYFDPPADPVLDLITPRQRAWFERFGKRQAGRFDALGFLYTSREQYDGFYPGYGTTWPTLHGAIGILWEQAGTRGLVVDREDEKKLYYHDGVRRHYVSGIATVETAAAGAREIVGDFYDYRASAVALGREGPVRDYLLLPGSTPTRAAGLADLLLRNGVEVRKLTAAVTVQARKNAEGSVKEWTAPAGSYHVTIAQPAGRLARSLLDPRFDMGEAFRKRQLDRKRRRLDDEIYDLTAWSLPLTHGVVSLAVEGPSELSSEPIEKAQPNGGVAGPDKARVGYLIHAEDDAAMLALAELIRAGFRVQVLDEAIRLGGVGFAKGTLLVRTTENPESLHDRIRELASRLGLSVVATDTGLVDGGTGLGGFQITWVKPPKVAMLVDRPASPFVGHSWYLFDQVWRYPATRVPGGAIADLDLTKYNVLVLPDGRYPGPLPDVFAERLKNWVRSGGTLILVKGAAAWGTEKSVGLLASKVVKKPIKAAAEPDSSAKPDGDKPGVSDEPRTNPDEESPDPVPGAFLRAEVYDDHFVTFGSPSEVFPLVNTDLVLTPLKPVAGRNLVNLADRDTLVSGFCWPQTLELMAGKPLVAYQALGKGHVVAFADDPNYRAMAPTTQRFFLNAVFFGPGH
ncbi:M14 family metallopeptidase [Planctomyces sp. SH-PL62]|uniref:M14 family metallopeptidase n=1 Tax=Planctomyces sp. SH-PL62 TaxID=1636152 RepID=UPI00078E9EF5|nr:M14 family metallopeptidase [Planctomyces sp. SH-PL62]AMV39259.1 Zinc carboxypeptidase [Planctomyces sp. SH-PL62]